MTSNERSQRKGERRFHASPIVLLVVWHELSERQKEKGIAIYSTFPPITDSLVSLAPNEPRRVELGQTIPI